MRALATSTRLHYVNIMNDSSPIVPPALHDAAHDTPAPAAEAKPDETVAAKPERLDPTRYGDWELNGKCVDF